MRYILIIICFFAALHASGQLSDFELWTGSEVNYGVTKKLDLSLEEQFRFFDNSTRLLEHNTEIKIAYDLFKWMKTSFAYRLSQENNRFDQFENQHRFTLDARFREKFHRFGISYRLRYQQSYSAYYASENGKVPDRIIRNRLTIEYDIKNFKGIPFAEYEYYFPLHTEFYIDKYEFSVGFEYSLSKKMDVQIAYSLRKQVWSDMPVNRNILALSIQYDL